MSTTDEGLERLHKAVTGHTPGPWTITGPSGSVGEIGDYAILDADERIISETFRDVGPKIQAPAEANAKLIAAAPALLEALERLMHLNEIDGVPAPGLTGPEYKEWRTQAIAAARDATRLARGGE